MEVVLSYSRRVGGVALAFAAVAAVAALAAGCGSSGSNGAAPKSTATDYFTCLRDNGVDIPQLNRSGRPTSFPSERPSRNPSRNPSAGADGGPGGGNGFPGGGFLGSTAPSGVDQQTWDKARQACESLRPTANPSGFPGRGNNGATAAYRNCLSDHGVTVSGPIEQLDSKDAKVAAALAACAPLRPSPRPS